MTTLILVLDGSLGDGMIALVSQDGDQGRLLNAHIQPGRAGAERLAGAVRDLLDAEGLEIGSLGLIAAVTGPGSFTGLRASLALAQGIALGRAVGLQGVRRGEAIRRQIGPIGGKALWCVGMARRERIFLERYEGVDGVRCAQAEAHWLDALPLPSGPVLLAGDARVAVASRLLAAGASVTSSDIERPDAVSVAQVALDQQLGRLAAHPALPLYVDPPEARLPAAGLRPMPV